MLNGKNIVLGVTGGIAAYKAADIANRLVKLGAHVDVIMTRHAAEFITPLTLGSLCKGRVVCDMFAPPPKWEIEHISLAKAADLFLIAPATANIIGKIACGISDDMLTSTVMATRAPVVFAPAMNDQMYSNPIVQRNIKSLSELGFLFIEPETGRLACETIGQGKLAAVDTIIDFVCDLLK